MSIPYDEIIQQLKNYYRNLHQCALQLSEEFMVINFISGETSRETFMPSGLRMELMLIEDEIDDWVKEKTNNGVPILP